MKTLRAMTEFCFNGTPYKSGEVVRVSDRQAKSLLANRLVYAGPAGQQPGDDREPAGAKQQGPAKDKQAVPAADKQLNGGKNKGGKNKGK